MADLGKRGFLRALVAAPVALSTAAQSVTQALAGHAVASGGDVNVPSVGYVGQGGVEGLQRELSWAIEHAEALQDDDAHHVIPVALIASMRADALRSVSPVNRLSIAAREASKIERARQISWSDRHIAKLKKKLGPLATLLDS